MSIFVSTDSNNKIIAIWFISYVVVPIFEEELVVLIHIIGLSVRFNKIPPENRSIQIIIPPIKT